MNTGSSEDYGVEEIIKDSDSDEIIHQYPDTQGNCFFGTLKLMWDQTAPLFKKKHLKNTFLICTAQFMIFVTSNG